MKQIIKSYPESQMENWLKCMKKLNKRKFRGRNWPTEGAFNIACCDEVEANIKHTEFKDSRGK